MTKIQVSGRFLLMFLLLFSLMFLLGSCGPESTQRPQFQDEYFTDAGTPVVGKWNALPVPVALSDDFTAEEKKKLKRAMEEWNLGHQKGGLITVQQQGAAPDANFVAVDDYLNSPGVAVYRQENWFEGELDDALAITRYRRVIRANSTTPEIVTADIIINDSGKFHITDLALSGQGHDLTSIVVHETGHLLGLAHFGEHESVVMASRLKQNQLRQDLSGEDRRAINDLYPATSVAAMPLLGPELWADQGSHALRVEQGTIELRASGECRHYVDGKLVHSHER